MSKAISTASSRVPRNTPMALTEALVARTMRAVEDAGPTPGMVHMTDADYARIRDEVLAGAPAGPLKLFAYGSLLWKPAGEVRGGERAVASGWHRSFCFTVQRFRGTVEQPGLMMALDRGGQCQGMVFEIAEPVAANLEALLRREMTILPAVNVPRWLQVRTEGGPCRALGFVVDPANPRYAGNLDKQAIAATLVTAVGHWGSGAQYLFETIRHLEACGIRDRNLWRLQELVAEEIGLTSQLTRP
ncbi:MULTISPECIES: gamma-glutamylcyclotransferase [unclassified Mesorhizobium]|jgi:glutathione-specific gamma-glutamylcyclotransferase|uniref:gamma-glutamylcyclotransferase n=1 Tax=unclassified Mesorhizobium TaxID=325217 RepID=UPI000FCB7CEF|nr:MULTISPECIES: gamma-glutamylcyclotransferase [unclassified Mesorhizobium]RUU66826.1 gamma-glutamylcyclotransferase [Mesorhizobium sp. M7A.T.Ca.TU.009.01.1.1]RUU71390.1 gamma-glutamylcyclotransferase [Mesorhizobium sp. M7A.T.Ca.TU.009.01.1.2]MCQ8875167.1 gamma-glutamylcyclotransferase [Mesorhizobium sp. LMG17149]RUT80599.1 gamma-glutamylcyclotransferase [Mesorhizobium sp. M7A.T.Ca.US.000.02.2.1]RUT85345.1 gamma-glutamylcyclotransferase [Mesorhizobium sp. M7A.T.Ca.US.000.02.1.1]